MPMPVSHPVMEVSLRSIHAGHVDIYVRDMEAALITAIFAWHCDTHSACTGRREGATASAMGLV